MRRPQYEHEVALLLKSDKELSVEDFMKACPGMPTSSVYTRIRSLVKTGRLSTVGTGRYRPVHKPIHYVPVTKWMKTVNQFLIDSCPGIDHCITQTGSNLLVEIPRNDLDFVLETLKKHEAKVVRQKEAMQFPGPLEGFILVGQLISDAPVVPIDSCPVPSLEKEIVDTLCAGKYNQLNFQKIMEVYPVNLNRLHRYASRRGVDEELSEHLNALNQKRIDMFTNVQKFMANIPITKAWVFGSFARAEETERSDLDLLVEYDPQSKVSLLNVIRFKLDLEAIIGRNVDLIENGSLRPFAVESAERDKYLIYER